MLDALLARPLTLPAVRGSALFLAEDGRPSFARGAGVSADDPAAASIRAIAALLDRARHHRSSAGHRRVEPAPPPTRTPPSSRCSETTP